MKKVYSKDIWRSMKKGKKRFFSLALIAALGVTMLTGLKAACEDLRYSADCFFDDQRLFDIAIVSTMGLTEEDVQVLGRMEGVAQAQGAYSETLYTYSDGKRRSAEVKTFLRDGMNLPYLLEGRLPDTAEEIAVTENYMLDTGKSIGDTLMLEELEKELSEEETPNYKNNTYVITAVAVDPTDVNSPDGAVSYRSSSPVDYTFFVAPEAVESDVYTAVYLTLDEASEQFCYSEAYEEGVKEIVDQIESQIQKQREEARYDSVVGEAREKLSDAERKAYDRFAEAEEEFTEAQQELAEGWEELEAGRKELEDGERKLEEEEQKAEEELAKAGQELSDGHAAVAEGEEQSAYAKQQLALGEQQIEEAKKELKKQEETAYARLTDARSQLESGRQAAEAALVQLTEQLTQLRAPFGSSWPEEAWRSCVETAKKSYMPAVQEQLKIGQLQEGLSAGGGGSTGYAGLQEEMSVWKLQPARTDTTVSGNIAPDPDSFTKVLAQLVDEAKQAIDFQIAALDPAAADYGEQLASLELQKQQLDAAAGALPQLASGLGQLEAAIEVLSGQLRMVEEQEAEAAEKFAAARQMLAGKESELTEGRRQLEEGIRELSESKEKLERGETEFKEKEKEALGRLADGRKELQDGRLELEEGQQELADGEREYEENKRKYEEKKEETEEKLADARREIENIDLTEWYVRYRSSLRSYENIRSDSAAIETVGTAFPVVFLVVAILISLTTITRMVEEDRGLIGTYKALGFTDKEIRRKYMLYAFSASLTGGVLGDLCGFVVLPMIVFRIFQMMYLLPAYAIRFDLLYGIGGAALFTGGIAGAAAHACSAELRQMPAVLMRPKAPRSGTRVFLEYITPVWRGMSFLNKVTARNLFRYKKRLFMTVSGIMGCTALVLCGFTIKDSVADLMPRQYEQVYQYDLMAAASAADNDRLLSYLGNLENKEAVSELLNVQIETVKVRSAQGGEDELQLFVVPAGASLEGYIGLRSKEGEPVKLENDGICITQNAAQALDLQKGDTVTLQNLRLEQAEETVSELVMNYLGNNVYMTQEVYERLFGAFKPNGVLAKLSDACEDQEAFAEELGRQDGVLSSVSTAAMRREFTTAFSMIHMVVYIIIIMAAGLAFVVLFTLSATNISERERELATIKVLGFFDREVHLYVDKETLILTAAGIVLGLPLGTLLGNMLTYALDMPSIYFAVSIHPSSYAAAAAIAFGFALLVNVITDRVLDRIDPVEALKSVE